MCVLWVSGDDFDPEACLRRSGFKPFAIWRKGDPRSRRMGPHGDSGFGVDVSKASWRSLDRQASDAAKFLTRHRRDFLRLRRSKKVDSMTLSFPLDLRIDGKRVAAQSDYLPPILIERAGALGIGIQIAIYPTRRRAK